MTQEQIFALWAERNGIVQKTEGVVIDLSNTNFGGILPVPLVENLISLTRNQSQWMGSIDTRTRARQSGEIPIVDWNEPATEMVGRNDGTKVTTQPPTRMVPYSCVKFKSEFYVTTEELREAIAGGIENFETKMTEDWATQLGNDMATLVMNGDKTLDTSSRTNRLLRAVNGVDIQTNAGANVFDAAGKAFGQGIFSAMIDYMPERFAEDPGLQWLFNRRTNLQWHSSLTNVNTTERMRSALGDQVISSVQMVPPMGISQIIVPQVSARKGPVPIAPTSAAASGNGILVVLTTMVTAAYVATAAAGDTRKIKIVYKPTGKSEVVAAINNGGTLQVTTVGKLGQDTVSTTASEYTVTLADETDIYLMNPKGIVLVYCNEWRSFRAFNKDYDRFEVTTYLEADLVVPIPETIVKFKRVLVPHISTWV